MILIYDSENLQVIGIFIGGDVRKRNSALVLFLTTLVTRPWMHPLVK
jgi:hypothetical protein